MTTAIARINASALNSADEDLSAEELRQRACSELLRQAAIAQGVDVAALRNRAESCLAELRDHDGKGAEDRFAQAASTLSNCPSGALGGDLGWLGAADCAPELAKELFGNAEPRAPSGVFPRLVHSRFGFHVLEVLERQPGVQQDFADVQGAVAMALRQESYIAALRQYLRQLAASAKIVGVDLDVSASPLPQ